MQLFMVKHKQGRSSVVCIANVCVRFYFGHWTRLSHSLYRPTHAAAALHHSWLSSSENTAMGFNA